MLWSGMMAMAIPLRYSCGMPRAGRAGGQDSDGASRPSSYEVTNVRPVAYAMILRSEPTSPLQDNQRVGQSLGQTRPKEHHSIIIITVTP